MRVTEKLALIDAIAREMQSRYSFGDIDLFLKAFQVRVPHQFSDFADRWSYVKATIGGEEESTILQLAEELDIARSGSFVTPMVPPRNWQNTKRFRLFLSHVSADKAIATRLKACLEPYAIAGFVAHEDILPTLTWQEEIERALATMDAFIAIHTAGFSASNWTQQEVGYAVGRGVKVISFKMGEDPTGFISKQQALPRLGRTAEQIAKEINALLEVDPRTKSRLADAVEDFNDIPF